MKTSFTKRTTDYFVAVGKCGRSFQCPTMAENWLVDQCQFQNKNESRRECRRSIKRLGKLVAAVADTFPNRGSDHTFTVDFSNGNVAVLIGSFYITESVHGYNVEFVTNWLTKNRVEICTGVPLEIVSAIVNNSTGARSYNSTGARPLHFNKKNVKFITERFGLK